MRSAKSFNGRSILLLILVGIALARGEETDGNATPQQGSSTSSADSNADANAKPNPKFDADNTDWGTYYDPKSQFCGKYDCYKILGFDFEEFGKQHPDRKEITQRYRSLSRAWHPDKSKHRDAKERFVKIARAYEVLTDEDTRKEYDFMRYNQEAYFKKYGTDVMWAYAPKTDTLLVILLLLSVGSAISWFAQKAQWQSVADKLIKAAVEDWGANQGGTPESKSLRERAVKILEEREQQQQSTTTDSSPEGQPGAGNADGETKKKKKVKVTASEKRKELELTLKPIVAELVDEMVDFGAGYHKPTWRDLLVVRLAYFPMTFVTGISWNVNYMIRRLRKLPLNDEEREVLTRRAVGEVNWASCDAEEHEAMITRDLWVAENMIAWEEEREVKLWSGTDRKRYARMKKKGIKLDKEE